MNVVAAYLKTLARAIHDSVVEFAVWAVCLFLVFWYCGDKLPAYLASKSVGDGKVVAADPAPGDESNVYKALLTMVLTDAAADHDGRQRMALVFSHPRVLFALETHVAEKMRAQGLDPAAMSFEDILKWIDANKDWIIKTLLAILAIAIK